MLASWRGHACRFLFGDKFGKSLAFRAPEKKEIPFLFLCEIPCLFLCGEPPPPRRLLNTQPVEVAFPLLSIERVVPTSQKEGGVLGEQKTWGGVG